MPMREPPTDEMKAQAVEEAEGKGPKAPEEKPKAAENGPAVEPNGPQQVEGSPTGLMRKPNGKYVSRAPTREEIAAMMPYFKDIGERPSFFQPIKRIIWDGKLFRERRKLRKQLKHEYGMKLNPREFENLATEVGLGLEHTPWLIWFKFFSWIFGGGGLATILGLGLLALGMFYGWSVITELAGSFTVQLNLNTMQSGFVLSETEDFEVKTGRLISDALDGVNAMTLDDMPKDINDHEGSLNGMHYVAYSFFIRNDGDEAESYEYVLNMTDSARGADKAIWCMLFEDGHQVIYAQTSSDGDPEKLFGYKYAPFYDMAYDKDYQYYKKDNGYWGVQTTAWESEEVVVRGLVRDVPPGGVHHYTVILWVEGYDPECTDDILDGYGKFRMDFNQVDEKKVTLFSNLYRTEYDEPIGSID